jgi:RNA polymerase sigma factor (sigma-70 family)
MTPEGRNHDVYANKGVATFDFSDKTQVLDFWRVTGRRADGFYLANAVIMRQMQEQGVHVLCGIIHRADPTSPIAYLVPFRWLTSEQEGKQEAVFLPGDPTICSAPAAVTLAGLTPTTAWPSRGELPRWDGSGKCLARLELTSDEDWACLLNTVTPGEVPVSHPFIAFASLVGLELAITLPDDDRAWWSGTAAAESLGLSMTSLDKADGWNSLFEAIGGPAIALLLSFSDYFSVFLQSTRKLLHYICRQQFASDPSRHDDFVAEALRRFYQARYRVTGQPVAYLTRILRRLIIDAIRAQERRPPTVALASESEPDDDLGDGSHANVVAIVVDLQEWLSTLTREELLTVVLHDMLDYELIKIVDLAYPPARRSERWSASSTDEERRVKAAQRVKDDHKAPGNEIRKVLGLSPSPSRQDLERAISSRERSEQSIMAEFFRKKNRRLTPQQFAGKQSISVADLHALRLKVYGTLLDENPPYLHDFDRDDEWGTRRLMMHDHAAGRSLDQIARNVSARALRPRAAGGGIAAARMTITCAPLAPEDVQHELLVMCDWLDQKFRGLLP